MELAKERFNLIARSMEIDWRRKDANRDLPGPQKDKIGTREDVGPAWMPEDDVSGTQTQWIWRQDGGSRV